MKYIGASSMQPTVSQQEPVHESEMNPNFGLTAEEATVALVSSPPRSTEPPPVATERRQRKFSDKQPDEKVDFLFSQLQATAGQIDRQSAVINVTRSDVIKQQLEMNTLKSNVQRQQAEITRQQAEIEQRKAENARLKATDEEGECQLHQMRAADNARGIDMNRLKERSITVQSLTETLKAKHDDMKEWYNSRKTKITYGLKKINDGFEFVRKGVNILWADRCKQQEALKKRDHDFEDLGNPDPSATSEQPPATASTQIVVFEPPQIESTQGTSGGTVEEIQQLESSSYVESSLAGTSSVPSSADLALQVVHPLLALNEMKAIDDVAIDNIPSEPQTADLENLEEIVFEGDNNKSTYVREDGTEFIPFNEDWLKENVDNIDEHLKNRDATDNAPDGFTEWRKQFLSKVAKPAPTEVQVDYLKYEKENLHGKIL
ncbi:hypothetical protein Hanom_Chr05g00435411 [Helianthus anomalus]